jgi:hypothetical protein
MHFAISFYQHQIKEGGYKMNYFSTHGMAFSIPAAAVR